MLSQMGLFSSLDVLSHLPRRYESYLYSNEEGLYHLEDKQRVVLLGKIIDMRPSVFLRGNMSKQMFIFETIKGKQFQVVAWNRRYLSSLLNKEDLFTFVGSYDSKNHCLSFVNIKKGEIKKDEALVPIYSLPLDFQDHLFRNIVAKCLEEEKGRILDIIPSEMSAKYRLISKYEAFEKVHFPKDKEDIRQGMRVLKYEEALLFCLRNQIVRGETKALIKGERRPISRAKVDSFISSLPYPLTKDQITALREGLDDMDSPSLMYRLLQGDVGTGKTLVSALMMYANATRGEQSAIMAPTDALAKQHFATLSNLFKGTGLKVSLLVGNLTYGERKEVLESINDGVSDIIVGTHALFSKDVIYQSLGLVIIDEQHKFGVNQRTLLASKGENADLLLMSATPIPRTLTMTIYGDLDVSTLAAFPSGKRDLETRIIPPSSKEISKEIKRSLAEGGRIFVVAPQIEGNEGDASSSVLKVYEAYSKAFPNKVALLHGKLDEESKEVALKAFMSGLCPILVATSVIEVGIDVKQADLMFVYDPSHFSLSSLHQLRGRIGRDGRKAKFFLVTSTSDEDELAKLNVLISTEDGFQVAEEDLKRRGPGDLAGVRQSGLPDFLYLNLFDDYKMFVCARDDATYILANEHNPDFDRILANARNLSKGLRSRD